MLREGHEHDGIELRFGGVSHRIDFQDLVGASIWLYPQTDVFIDLADARERDGGDVRFGVADARSRTSTGRPVIRYTDADGAGTRSRPTSSSAPTARAASCRARRCRTDRRQYFREYPFAWFGILCEAPPSAPELIYSRSRTGSR